MAKVSKEIITVEEGSGLEDELRSDRRHAVQVNGYQNSPYFINDQQSQSAELEKP